ncbi:MAG: hypothetical protein CL561_08115 [Alphaproteobacteria bacterium]|nr:hypothetical protein [Alphaproteobacteria bacterium]|tara:strand:+ start:7541 stop:8173 length:633 start_codon:yes stop_codon:yes gene_type:complete
MVKYYDESRFLGQNITDLANIILTGDTRQRWAYETQIFADAMINQMSITERSLILDYGVGIGRIAKELIHKTGCSVIGVDISEDMLRESVSYVSHQNYTAMSLHQYQNMVKEGKIEVDGAYSIWVLQHCDFEPAYQTILRSLPKGAPFFIANTINRCVPVIPRGWADDGLDIRARLRQDFNLTRDATNDLEKHLPENHYSRVFCEFMCKL